MKSELPDEVRNAFGSIFTAAVVPERLDDFLTAPEEEPPHIIPVQAGLRRLERVEHHGGKRLNGGRPYQAANPLGYVPALGLAERAILAEISAVPAPSAGKIRQSRPSEAGIS